MKKLTVYNVYLDDGKSAFRVTVPAASKKRPPTMCRATATL